MLERLPRQLLRFTPERTIIRLANANPGFKIPFQLAPLSPELDGIVERVATLDQVWHVRRGAIRNEERDCPFTAPPNKEDPHSYSIYQWDRAASDQGVSRPVATLVAWVADGFTGPYGYFGALRNLRWHMLIAFGIVKGRTRPRLIPEPVTTPDPMDIALAEFVAGAVTPPAEKPEEAEAVLV